MKISENGFEVKDNISIGEYLVMVEQIVEFSFNTDDNGKILGYTPHYVTAGLPALVVNFCIDGVEIEPHEVGFFNSELVNAVKANEELNEVVTNIISGMNDYKCGYFYNALDDAEKIIKVKLEQFTPANQFLIEANKLIENINEKFNGVDVKSFADNLEKILSSGNDANEKEKKGDETN